MVDGRTGLTCAEDQLRPQLERRMMKMHETHPVRASVAMVLLFAAGLLLVGCGDGDVETSGPESGPSTVGDTLETEAGKLTIHSYEAPAQTDVRTIHPDNVFAVVDVEGCVNQRRSGVITLYTSAFTLEMPDGSERRPTLAAREPALSDPPVRAGNCIRGFLTFEVPLDERPVFVVYRTIPEASAAEQFSGEAVRRWAIE